MHPVSLNDLNEVEILAPHHYTQKGFAKKKHMKFSNYCNTAEAVLSQGCSACNERGHNVRTCVYREIMDHI